MKTRTLIVVLIVAGLAVGVGFFFGPSLNGPTAQNTANEPSSVSSEKEDPLSFRIGSVDGRFHDLKTDTSGSNWSFHGKVTFSTPEESPETIEVSYLDLASGDAIPVAQALTLLPERESQTMSFAVEIPSGAGPVALRVQGPRNREMKQVKLPGQIRNLED